MRSVSDEVKDEEQGHGANDDLTNRDVQVLQWHKLSVSIPRRGKSSLDLLCEVDGLAATGRSTLDCIQGIVLIVSQAS